MSYDNGTSNKYKKTFKKAWKGGDSEPEVISGAFAHIEAIQAKPIEVVVFNNFDKAFKAFRSLVQKEKILSLFKEKQTYEKPSDKKRRKRNERKRKLYELENKEEYKEKLPKKSYNSQE